MEDPENNPASDISNSNNDISVPPCGDIGGNVSANGRLITSNVCTSENLTVEHTVSEEMLKLNEVIKSEHESVTNESITRDNDEKEEVKTEKIIERDADQLDLENLFVEDTSGKKVFEFQVKYNNEEGNVGFESSAMAQQVNCMVESLISSIGQDDAVQESSTNTTKRAYTKRIKGRKLTNSERQRAYRVRHRNTYLQRERERKRRSYVPAHLRPPEILAKDRERKRIYQRLYNLRRKLKGSRLTDTSIYNSQPGSSSTPNKSTTLVKGSKGQNISSTLNASHPLSKSSTNSMIVTNSVIQQRSNKRKFVNTPNIPDVSTKSNKKVKSLTTSPHSLTGMCKRSWKKDNSMKEQGKNTQFCKEGTNVRGFSESPIPCVSPHVEHKLDLNGINYFELVKLRDACNYYIQQYENMFLQQMTPQAASQQNGKSVNSCNDDDDNYDDDDYEDVDDEEDDDYEVDDDMDLLSSDTEDSGYSGKLLKAKNVKGQVPNVSPMKRSERLMLKRSLQVNQIGVDTNSTSKGKGGITKGKKQMKKLTYNKANSLKTNSSVSSTKSKGTATKTHSNGLPTACTSQQQNSAMSYNLRNALQAVVKLEPIDQDDELLNNVLVDLDLSALSKDKPRSYRHYPHYNKDGTVFDKPRSHRAIIQRRYRERQKAKHGSLYMERERLRSRQNYVPSASLDKTSLINRREKTRLRTKAYRNRKKITEMLETENSSHGQNGGT